MRALALRSAVARHSSHTSRGSLATNQNSSSSLPWEPGVSRPTQWSESASSSEILAGLGLFGNTARFWISALMERLVS